MNTINAKLEREAVGVAQRFRQGQFGPCEGDAVDVDGAANAAIQELEERCPTSPRVDCINAFRMAILWTTAEPNMKGGI